MLRDARLSLLALILCSAGCARGNSDAALIRIDGVEQTLERPSELLLRGEGFPQGMRGEAHLRGALYAAGRDPLAVDLHAPCRALGSGKARVELDPLAASVPWEGPFEGQLEVRFGKQEDAQLLGRVERALFRIGRAPTIAEQFALSQAAHRFQRALGIELSEQGGSGLSVMATSASSPAAHAGLSAHDLLLRMNGRPLQRVRDMVAQDQAHALVLELRRAQEGVTRVVRISTGSANATPDLVLLLLSLALGIGAGLVLVSALPAHVWWAPQRREYWLLLCCAVCTVCLGALVVRDVDPLLSRMCGALVLGALAAGGFVCLRRRVIPTLHTSKDPDLAPLL